MAALKIFSFACLAMSINAFHFKEEESDGRSPLEFGDKYQGDMLLSPEQEAIINGSSRGSRTGLLNTQFRWPKNSNGFVVLPFQFDQYSGFTNAEKNTIYEGMIELQKSTCIRFVQRTYQTDFVQVMNGQGCWAALGRQGGQQQLSLNRDGCVYKGTVMHEFIHALGYHHMHNHIDRDSFVRIYLENVEPAQRYNFEKVNPAVFGNFGTGYDYLSVMHYPRWAFSSNGRDTMVPIDRRYIDYIGSQELTEGDITRINNMYECFGKGKY